MKTRALFTAALLGTAVLFSACGSKTETNEMPAADSTAAPVTPSAAPAPAPTTPPPAVDTTVNTHHDTVITKTDTAKKM